MSQQPDAGVVFFAHFLQHSQRIFFAQVGSNAYTIASVVGRANYYRRKPFLGVAVDKFGGICTSLIAAGYQVVHALTTGHRGSWGFFRRRWCGNIFFRRFCIVIN